MMNKESVTLQDESHQSSKTTKDLSKLEKNIFGVSYSEIPQLLPGLLLTVLITLLSIWLSDLIGINLLGFEKSPISPIMLALIIGILVGNIISIPPIFSMGIKFSIKKLLRLGIILLGIRLCLLDFIQLGVYGLPVVILCIVFSLLVTIGLSKRLGISKKLGTLIAVGTSICGVSAIVATSPTIKANEEETAYAVAVITIFGLVATFLYPFIAPLLFNGNSIQAGIWLGTSIHDTSQVTGAALVYADYWSDSLTLDVATITKLVRNLFMVLIIPIMAIYEQKMQQSDLTKITDNSQSTDKKSQNNPQNSKKLHLWDYFPKFILLFITLVIIRTIGDSLIDSTGAIFSIITDQQWGNFISFVQAWAKRFMIIALAGVGLNTNVKSFRTLGIKPLIAGLIAALTTGLVSFSMLKFLQLFFSF